MIPVGNEDLTDINRKAHLKSDVDSGTRALPHTLGKGPMQAAPGNHTHDGSSSGIGFVPLGGATVYFGDSDPDANFLILDGRELLRADYTDLLAVPGLSFANGPSGAAYFVLPNPTNRDLVGAGGDYALGSTGGADTVTLVEANLPSHTHSDGTLTVASSGAHKHTLNWSSADGANSTHIRRGDSSATTGNNSAMFDDDDGAHTHDVSGATGATGSGTAVGTKNRYLAVNYIIRVH